MIKGLHHNAYRCRDSEETRQFYQDFLGLPLAGTLALEETKTGRKTQALHTFYRLDDGSYLAFFEVPDTPFAFKTQVEFNGLGHIGFRVLVPALIGAGVAPAKPCVGIVRVALYCLRGLDYDLGEMFGVVLTAADGLLHGVSFTRNLALP